MLFFFISRKKFEFLKLLKTNFNSKEINFLVILHFSNIITPIPKKMFFTQGLKMNKFWKAIGTLLLIQKQEYYNRKTFKMFLIPFMRYQLLERKTIAFGAKRYISNNPAIYLNKIE